MVLIFASSFETRCFVFGENEKKKKIEKNNNFPFWTTDFRQGQDQSNVVISVLIWIS